MKIRYYIRRISGFLALLLSVVLVCAGSWGIYIYSRLGKDVGGFFVMFTLGSVILYGAVRWIRDLGYGLEDLPPDLQLPGFNASANIARENLSKFIELVEDDVDGAYIKFPMEIEDSYTEHIWGYVHSLKEGEFIVSLANLPFQQESYSSGRLKVKTSEIEDWMVIDEHGDIKGAYSLIAIFEDFKTTGRWLSPKMKRQQKRLIDFPG